MSDTMREVDYQLMLDDLGRLVDALGLPVGQMLNQSPRLVLLDCITEVGRRLSGSPETPELWLHEQFKIGDHLYAVTVIDGTDRSNVTIKAKKID